MNFANLESNTKISSNSHQMFLPSNIVYNFDRKKNLSKNCLGLTFIVLFMLFGELKKSSFTPLNCWVTKLTLRCLLSLKRPLTSIRSGKVGEIQWSMTKVVFVLDFGFENISPNRTTTILVLPCRLLLFTVVGSGDRQAKWRNCHRCISSPAEHSRQRYQKINFPNPRMHFPQKLVK